MRSPWSPLPHLSIATVAISQADVVFAAPGANQGAAAGITLLTAAADAWLQLNSWLGDSYHQAPTLMLVLIALLVLPPLAVAGFILRRQRHPGDRTMLISRPSSRANGTRRSVTARTELSAWPTEAWVEIGDARHVIGRAMVRIGREADNDICLSEKTVHRYHAVIRRTTDGDVVVTDLSGPEGNGVLVNGVRVGESRLKPGDIISIGEVKINFAARPI